VLAAALGSGARVVSVAEEAHGKVVLRVRDD
jgi:hypothetical protein